MLNGLWNYIFGAPVEADPPVAEAEVAPVADHPAEAEVAPVAEFDPLIWMWKILEPQTPYQRLRTVFLLSELGRERRCYEAQKLLDQGGIEGSKITEEDINAAIVLGNVDILNQLLALLPDQSILNKINGVILEDVVCRGDIEMAHRLLVKIKDGDKEVYQFKGIAENITANTLRTAIWDHHFRTTALLLKQKEDESFEFPNMEAALTALDLDLQVQAAQNVPRLEKAEQVVKDSLNKLLPLPLISLVKGYYDKDVGFKDPREEIAENFLHRYKTAKVEEKSAFPLSQPASPAAYIPPSPAAKS